ncbi:interleukin-1 receptor-like 1 isoform X2 [Hypomesus transpacificus]|uniref:interleukin-1 receptor-like 1 isoform X2 n=1 Tax=Hypomesus transpacificus TaxID=137520 RepID=UPI001F072E69|nr:interleukin-1 receptor-like 1 isoform X2 [Hypomesus transpacificus]
MRLLDIFQALSLISSSIAAGEGCKEYGLHFKRSFSVVGEAAMLNCTLVAPEVFDFWNVSYNIHWYSEDTLELGQDTERTLVRGTALWFLNASLQDTGTYLCVVRTPTQCFSQTTSLIINQTNSHCDRPDKYIQYLTNLVNDKLVCPLKNMKRELGNSYSFKWYKDCQPIETDDKFMYRDGNQSLTVKRVEPKDRGLYTCTVTFDLGGIRTSMSATINCGVKEEYVLQPRLVVPINESVKAELGSNFSKECRVFVPCVGEHWVGVYWLASGADDYIPSDSTQRVFHQIQPDQRQVDGEKGVWLNHLLTFSEVKQEDFYVNYSCHVYSSHNFVEAQFTLLPADPNLMLPVGLLLGCLALNFTAAVVFYYLFKINIMLCFRGVCPFLYTETDADGKLYDAYVAYPRLFGDRANKELEGFALHTMPQVLEGKCGYKLFIPGRDNLPGEAVVDVMEERIRASRRLLLLYSASSFSSSDVSVVSEAWQHWYERETAMHHALLEGSLRVVLLELEELHPAQLAVLPPSLRQLRKKQGVVRVRKNHTARKTTRRPGGWSLASGEEERQEGVQGLATPPLCPSSRFWKELRYHMPVRGKRTPCSERETLGNV